MKNMPIYEALAQAFAVEGVDTHFMLMGDGNMHWTAAMKNLDGTTSRWISQPVMASQNRRIAAVTRRDGMGNSLSVYV